MRRTLALALAIGALLLTAPRAHGDGEEEAFTAFSTAVDEMAKRVEGAGGASGDRLRSALGELQTLRGELDGLLRSMRDLASEVESAESHARFLKGEWESAKRQVDWKDKVLDGKLEQLRTESASREALYQRIEQQKQALDVRSAAIDAQRASLDNTNEGAVAAFNQAVAQYNADLKAYNEEAERSNAWRDRLLATQVDLIKEREALLQETLQVSAKEREWAEAENKAQTKRSAREEKAGAFPSALATANAKLEGLGGGVEEASRPVPAFDEGPVAYAPRESEEQAQATSLSEAGVETSTLPAGLRDRIFVLPPHGAAGAADVRVKIRADRVAEAAKAYAPMPPDRILIVPPDPLDPDRIVGVAESSSGPADAVPVNLDAVISPGMLVTRDSYEQARRDFDRLTTLAAKLEAKLGDLARWGEGSREQRAEFEKIRAEACRGAIQDVLTAMQVGACFEALEKAERFRSVLPPGTGKAVEAAMAAVSAELYLRDVKEAESSPEKARARISAVENAATILEKVAAAHVGEHDPAFAWIERTGKQFRLYSKAASFVVEQDAKGREAGPRSMLDATGDALQLVAEGAAVYDPPLEVGLALKSLAERELKKAIVQPALDDLSAALRSNFEAQRHLQEKLERVRGFAEEEKRTIDAYEALPPRERGRFELRDLR